MIIDPAQLSAKRLYSHLTALVVPRPIAWVSTRSKQGKDNIAPFSYFNAVCSAPPTLMISVGSKDAQPKDTAQNIMDTSEFAISLVDSSNQLQMDQSSDPTPEDEFTAFAIEKHPCRVIGVCKPRSTPATFECKLAQTVTIGASHIFFGTIVSMEISDVILGESGYADPEKYMPIGRVGSNKYCSIANPYTL